MSNTQTAAVFRKHNNTVQPMQSDVRRIFLYEDFNTVPAPLNSPLEASEYAQFIGKDDPVTFTLKVPLNIVVDCDLLAEFVETNAFANTVYLSSVEYRAVGASFETFEVTYSGCVHIQVTCAFDK